MKTRKLGERFAACCAMAERKRGPKTAPLTRSQIMARIRAQDTTPELAVRTYLWKRGVRFRLRQRVAGTRPDIAWKNHKVSVFIDGCFWHGCPLHCRRPATRKRYWNPKLDRNIKRDVAVTQALREAGWIVLRFWEHEVSDDLPRVGGTIMEALASTPSEKPRTTRSRP